MENTQTENKRMNHYGTREELSNLLELWGYVWEVQNQSEGCGDLEAILDGIQESFYEKITDYVCLFENGMEIIATGSSVGEGIRQILEASTKIKISIEEAYPDLFEKYSEKVSRRNKCFEEAWSKRINSKIPNNLFRKLAE